MVEYGAIMWNPYIICFFALESASVHLVFQCSCCMNSLCETHVRSNPDVFYLQSVSTTYIWNSVCSVCLFSAPFLINILQEERVQTSASIRLESLWIFFRKPDSFLSPNAAQAQKQTINYSTDFRGLLPNEFFHLTPLLFLVSELKKHSQSEVLRVLSTSS